MFQLVKKRLDQIAKEIEDIFIDLDRQITKATASNSIGIYSKADENIAAKALDRIILTDKPPKVKIKTKFEKAFKKYLATKNNR